MRVKIFVRVNPTCILRNAGFRTPAQPTSLRTIHRSTLFFKYDTVRQGHRRLGIKLEISGNPLSCSGTVSLKARKQRAFFIVYDKQHHMNTFRYPVILNNIILLHTDRKILPPASKHWPGTGPLCFPQVRFPLSSVRSRLCASLIIRVKTSFDRAYSRITGSKRDCRQQNGHNDNKGQPFHFFFFQSALFPVSHQAGRVSGGNFKITQPGSCKLRN